MKIIRNKEKIKRGKIYDRIYDDFIKLIKGEINKVVVSQYEIYELSKTHYWTDTDGEFVYRFVRNTTYADSLRKLVIDNGISQTKDIITGDFIFYK